MSTGSTSTVDQGSDTEPGWWDPIETMSRQQLEQLQLNRLRATLARAEAA